MLSFMREQTLESLPARKSAKAADGTGASPANPAQDQEYLTVAPPNKNLRKTTYVLAVLFAAGVLCLLFMIKKNSPKTAEAKEAETEIYEAIGRLMGIKSDMSNRMDEIVEKFYEFSDVHQIGVQELTKNPFMTDALWDKLKKLNDDNLIDTSLITHQQAAQEAANLKLLSIMRSEQGNYCMINEKFLHEEESIRGFKVRQIGEDFVRLVWENNEPDDIEIVLKLSE